MADWGLQDISTKEDLWGQGDITIAPTTAWGEDDPDAKVGFLGAIADRPFEKIPFSPLGAIRTLKASESARRLQRFDYALTEEKAAKLYPKMLPAHRMDIVRNSQELQKGDIAAVEDYLIDADRQYTLGGRVGQIVSEMPAFMIEFFMTGGLQALGKTSAKQAGARLLSRYATTTAGKAALATSGFAIGTATRAAGMPHRAVEAVLRRQIPQNIDVDEVGNVKITGKVEQPATALWKGLLDHYIEIASEQTGEFFAPAISRYFRKLPLAGKFLSAIERKWLKLHPGKTASDFIKKTSNKVGFHGVLSEIGEEYLGDVSRAIVDVDDFGANIEAQRKHGRNANIIERISAGVKRDTANLPAMLIAFSIPGALGRVASIASVRKTEADARLQQSIEAAIGMDLDTPTQIETAEGSIGFEDDFLIEKLEAARPEYEFKEPGISKVFTPKWLLNRILGLETLVQDVDAAEVSRNLEQTHLNSWTNKIEHKIKGLKSLRRLPETLPTLEIEESLKKAEVVFPETQQLETAEGIIGFPEDINVKEFPIDKTTARKLSNKITKNKPLYIMRDLLDTYDEAPDFLTTEEQNVFNQVRELTRYLRQRANLVRERQGLEPIREVKGYITHWFDAVANRVVKKDLPVHSGYLYWLMRSLPKTIKNPTAEKRRVKGILEKDFSKDLGKLLRVMTAYDLRDIHLMEPYQATWDELQRLRKERLVPDATYREIENYLLYDIRKHKTFADKAFNATLKKPVDFVNKLLAPTGHIINDPSRAIFGTLRRFGQLSGLGFRLKPPTRNLGQRLLLLDLYRGRDYAKAQAVAVGLAKMPEVKHPITGELTPLIDLVREQDWYQISLRKFEDIYSAITKTEQAAMYIYGKTHVGSLFLSNVEVAALTGYYDWLNRFQQSRDVNAPLYKHAVKQAKKLNVPVQELLTQETDMMWNIREAVRRTQWEYMSISMPVFFRGDFNRAIGIFQSWWMNYFFNHCRECTNQIITGRNSQGRLLTPYGRLRALKGMGTIVAMGRLVEGILGIEMLKYLFMPVPGYLPPIPELIAGIIQYFTADTEQQRKKAASKIKYGLKFWIPFSAFLRDANRLLSGEYDISDFLFYKKK